jgi:hypothetical protein
MIIISPRMRKWPAIHSLQLQLWRSSFAKPMEDILRLKPSRCPVPSEGWSRRRDLHSRGARRPAVYETAAVAAEPHRRENGLPSIAPSRPNEKLRFRISNQVPKVPFCEDVTRTAFQILFKMLSLLNRLERHVDLDLPRHELRSVWALSSVVIHEPLTEIRSMANVALVRMAQAL